MKLCTFVLAALIATMATGADDEKDRAIKQEREKLQGKWRQVSVETNGKVKEIPPDVDVIVTIDGDKWTTENLAGKFESLVKIDPTQNPKALDRIRKGKDGKADESGENGIYKLDKDTLTICIARSGFGGKPEDAKERPKEFKTTEGGTIYVYKRFEK